MRHYAVCIGLLFALAPGFAQEDVLRPRGAPIFEFGAPERGLPLMLGIEAGLNWNIASASLDYTPFTPTNTPPQQFKSGTGFSPTASIVADLGLTPKLGLHLRLGYDVKTFGHSGTAEADCRDPATGVYLGTVPISVDWSFTMSSITAGVGLRYELTPQLWLTAGLVSHFLTSNEQKETLISGSDQCGFINPADGQLYRELRVTGEFNSPPMKKTRFGAELGLGYKVALSHNLWLVPQLRFQLLSTFRDDIENLDAWKSSSEGSATYITRSPSQHSLQLLVGLWFGL